VSVSFKEVLCEFSTIGVGEGKTPETAHRFLRKTPVARDRILRLLAESGEALSLKQLLPAPNQQTAHPQSRLRQRTAWSSTFVASLELAKQGDVTLAQAKISIRSLSASVPSTNLYQIFVTIRSEPPAAT
jgi:hypothetical protein